MVLIMEVFVLFYGFIRRGISARPSGVVGAARTAANSGLPLAAGKDKSACLASPKPVGSAW